MDVQQYCTDDHDVWTRVFDTDEYKLSELDPAGKLVLDVGAHIGSFAAKALELGARRVVSLEPDEGSCAMYRKGLETELLAGQAILLPYACWDRSEPRMLYSADTVPSERSLILHSGPGRWCSTVPLAVMLEMFRPDVLKLDCEGAEYAAILGCGGKVLPSVLLIAFHAVDRFRDNHIRIEEGLKAFKSTTLKETPQYLLRRYVE